MFTSRDMEWINDRFDLRPNYVEPDPELVRRWKEYRNKHRKAQDAVTERLRKESK